MRVLVILAMEGPHTLPAAVPFLLIDNHWLALRTSNLILLPLLSAVGYKWGAVLLGSRGPLTLPCSPWGP